MRRKNNMDFDAVKKAMRESRKDREETLKQIQAYCETVPEKIIETWKKHNAQADERFTEAWEAWKKENGPDRDLIFAAKVIYGAISATAMVNSLTITTSFLKELIDEVE